MNITEAQLRELLVKQNYVSSEDMLKAVDFAEHHNTSAVEYLQGEDILNRDLLGQAIAEYYDIPYIDLNSFQSAEEVLDQFPSDMAKRLRLVLCSVSDTELTIATDVPDIKAIETAVRTVFPQQQLHIGYALTEDVDSFLVRYRKTLDTRFSKILEQHTRVAPEIIDEIIQDALLFHASDIHIETQKERMLIRFRIDGVLHDAGKLPKAYYESIINRIKVQARLRIDEHFSTQDGAIRYEQGEYQADIRVSIVPTIEGEKIVMRVLSQYVKGLTIRDLGLSPEHHEILRQAYSKPFGMIIVTGPTGSGKSTTLYAALKELNDSEVNITTIEDPVEYKIAGVNQIQVNPRTNITFAQGLRSIVRQDPDIILVGEIRDRETAEISVNAALTGHLLFSTFHANDAATAIPRLLDMGVEPFLLASTLELIVAQRLVRKICERCRVSVQTKAQDVLKQFPMLKGLLTGPLTLYRGKGCVECHHTGFRGRVAIFEMIPVHTTLSDLILRKPSAQEVWTIAQKEGVRSMFEDGLHKVTHGITTLDELVRVAHPS